MEDGFLQALFEPALVAEINKHAKPITISAGNKILNIGQTIQAIPLVLNGVIKVTRIDEQSGNELLLYYINPAEGCAITFTCCMQQTPSEIEATAEEDCTILAIPIYLMDDWMMKYPSWKAFVLKTIRNKFNELLKAIDQLAFQKLDERLIHYLKQKSAVTASTLINLSHDQIAQELATSRVVISRLLKKLEEEGRLILYRHQIKLLAKL